MTGKLLTRLVLGAFCVGQAGCMSFNHFGFERALHAPSPAPVPMPTRGRVHVFLMNGLDVIDAGRVNSLRDQLVESGFAKVYVAQRADRDWYYRELRRVTADEPEARLVLIGYGGAAAPVYNLTYEAERDGLPVDALVLIDPVGLNGDLAAGLKAHSLVVRSHNWRGGAALTAKETVSVPGVGHRSLPCHTATVDSIVRILTASASSTTPDSAELLPFLPLTDTPDPSPRPFARQPHKAAEPDSQPTSPIQSRGIR
ncbi:MAG: hypothetical protein U0871_10965 [Gemmataceae bacterium]